MRQITLLMKNRQSEIKSEIVNRCSLFFNQNKTKMYEDVIIMEPYSLSKLQAHIKSM